MIFTHRNFFSKILMLTAFILVTCFSDAKRIVEQDGFYKETNNTEKKFILVLDPGHGGGDPGGLGSMTREKDIVLKVGLLVEKKIRNEFKDVKVIMTRNKDVFIPLKERANIANKAHADLFVSIHANCASNTKAVGISTFTLGAHRTKENLEIAKRENKVIEYEIGYKAKYEGFDPDSDESYIMFELMQDNYIRQSVDFASKVQHEADKKGRHNRGVRQAGFLVLARTSMPSVLIELGFITNRKEERFMKSSYGQKVLANSIVAAFKEFKEEYDEKNEGLIKDTDTIEVKSSKHSKIATENNISFKIQILTSKRFLKNNDKHLHNYKTDFYLDRGLYKYTIGTFTNLNEAQSKCRKLKKTFPDAFVISFKNNKRIPMVEAKEILSTNKK